MVSTALKVIIGILVLALVLTLLALLPAVHIDSEAVVSSSAWSWIMAAMYFIPTHTVVTILGIVLVLGVWSLIVAVVKSLWDVLPFK